MEHALRMAGMSQPDLARALNVSSKAVSLWVSTGRMPHPRNQLEVAKLLGVPAETLWPPSHHSGRATDEVVGAWARRADSPSTLWWELFVSAVTRVDILGYATLFLTEQHADLVPLLLEKTGEGCRVRIVLADPAGEAAAARDREEGLDGGLVARIRTALYYYRPLLDSEAEIRLQSAPMYNSIFRFDGEMLVTPHLYGVPGKLAPLFHLRAGGAGLFDRFTAHYDALWDASTPLNVI